MRSGFAIAAAGAIFGRCASRSKIPSAAARAFVKDMRTFHAAKTGLEKDEIAARQLNALRDHLPRGAKLRLTDVHELFLAMKEDL
jgi:hypothetical protein